MKRMIIYLHRYMKKHIWYIDENNMRNNEIMTIILMMKKVNNV
jgi:hypothetical protein